MTITAVLSAFDNEITISEVVLKILANASCVIVVDDGSTDGTAEKARLAGAEVIRHNNISAQIDCVYFGQTFPYGVMVYDEHWNY